MSASVQASLANEFGQPEHSDCTLRFYCCGSTSGGDDSAGDRAQQQQPAKRRKVDEAQPAPLPEASTPIGEPLPAHKFVLRGGSARFRAQLARWTQKQGFGAKPVLRVPLDGADELPHALSAVQFMYTGKLDVSDAPSLLQVRRQAAYLQVEGCGEACDAALLASVIAPQPVEQQAGALAGVVQLYGCWDLLLGMDLGPATIQTLLHACRQQLVKHSGSAAGGQLGPAAGPSSAGSCAGLGELLAWAFGDAPSLMSDLETRKQMEVLPAAAMEALLGCDSFATDNEATVLLMLLVWLKANPGTYADTRQRLLKLVRLSQLSYTYLHRLLPLLTCLNLSPQELRFLQEYTAASDTKLTGMKQAAEGRYDLSSAWYRAVPRPAPDWNGNVSRRSYEWCVGVSELKAWLSLRQKTVCLEGKLANGGSRRVVANGFEWYPGVVRTKEGDTAGVYLCCSLPSSLGLNLSPEGPVLVNPGFCRLVVYKGDSDDGYHRDEAWGMNYGRSYVEPGKGVGYSKVLPLGAPLSAPSAHQQTPAATTALAEDPQLARLAPYIRDGKLWGCLSWEEEELEEEKEEP